MTTATQAIKLSGRFRQEHPTTLDFHIGHNNKSLQGVLHSPFDTETNEELQWLLEKHPIEDPFSKTKAQIICESLDSSARFLFDQIKPTIDQLLPVRPTGQASQPLDLQISGEDGDCSIHSLPWEALSFLQEAQINVTRVITPMDSNTAPSAKDKSEAEANAAEEASLNEAMFLTQAYLQPRKPTAAIKTPHPHVEPQTQPKPINAPPKSFRILFLAARNADVEDLDIPYRLLAKIAQKAVDAARPKGSVEVEYVRPGTLEALQAMLEKKEKGWWDLVHLDMHGAVKAKGKRAVLYLNSSDDPSSMSATKPAKIGKLLVKHGVSIVLMNACKSATTMSGLESNAAATLVNAGVPCVVGMSFNLLVSSAEVFIPEFYQRLFQNRNDVIEALRLARRAMTAHRTRKTILDVTELPDAILPVVYHSPDIHRMHETPTPGSITRAFTDMTIRSLDSTEGLTSRDLDILRLEMALIAQNRAIEFTGPATAGKTYFLRHAEEWWRQTGFVMCVVWVDGRESRNAASNIDGLQDVILDRFADAAEKIGDAHGKILLVLDHLEDFFISASATAKEHLLKSLQDTFDYIVIVSGRSAQTLLPIPTLRLLPLSTVSAVQIATGALKAHSKIDLDNVEERYYLDRCVWLLGRNPLAIRLAFSRSKFDRKQPMRSLFEELQLPGPKSEFVRAAQKSQFKLHVQKCYDRLGNDEERLIMLALGQARRRIMKDPEHLIKSLVVTENLPVDSSAISGQYACGSLKAYTAMIIDELKRTQRSLPPGALQTTFLGYTPYRDHFRLVIQRLVDGGLLTDMEKYWDMHPLLPFALTAIGFETDKKMTLALHAAFHNSYRLLSLYWQRVPLVNLWGEPCPADGAAKDPTIPVLEDFANISAAIRRAISHPAKEWISIFPWNLMTFTSVYYCSIFSTDLEEAAKNLAVDLSLDYLHEYNKMGSFRQGLTRGRAILEQIIPQDPNHPGAENGGSHRGIITALSVSICLSRHYNFRYNGIKITFHFKETLRLWLLLHQLYGFLSSDLWLSEVITMYVHFCGFFSYNPELSTNLLSTADGVWEKLGAHTSRYGEMSNIFNDGRDEAYGLVKHFSAAAQAELDETKKDENDPGGSKEKDSAETSAPATTLEDLKRDDNIQELAALDTSSVPTADLKNASLQLRAGSQLKQQPRLSPNVYDLQHISHLVTSSTQVNQSSAIEHRYLLAQRMFLRRQWSDALTQFQEVRKLLEKDEPYLKDQSYGKDVQSKKAHQNPLIYGSILNLESRIYEILGNTELQLQTTLRVRNLCSHESDINISVLILLLTAYNTLFDLGQFKDLDDAVTVDMERMAWIIERSCLSFCRALVYDPNVVKHLSNVAKRYGAEDIIEVASDAADEREWGYEGIMFAKLLFGGLFHFGRDGSVKPRKERMKVIFLLVRKIHVDGKKVIPLLEDVMSIIFSRPPSDCSATERLFAVCAEAERVLFGTKEDCLNLKYLTDFEGTPLRRKWPWQTDQDYALGTSWGRRFQAGVNMRALKNAKT